MKPLWTWSGKYFGYLDGDDLWTCGGKHVGRLQDDGIYGPDGRYLGEIESDDRLITCKSKKALELGSGHSNLLLNKQKTTFDTRI